MVLGGVYQYGFTQARVAETMGISQPAAAKPLQKAEVRLRDHRG